MKHPEDTFQYPDYAQELGYGSPAWEREWDYFMRQRESLVNEALARSEAARVANQENQGQPPPGMEQHGANWQMPFTDLFARMQPGGRVTPPADLTHSQYNDLLGAADMYGISNAESMHPDQLQMVVQARRAGMVEDRARRMAEGELDFSDQAIESVQQTLAAMGVGPTQAIFDAVQNVPFIGSILERTKTVQDADRWLSMVNEGYRSNLSVEDWGHTIGSGLGQMTGYVLAGGAILKGFAAAGAAIPGATAAWGSLGPISKGALAGLGVEVVLEGGNPGELQMRRGPDPKNPGEDKLFVDVRRKGTATEDETAVPLNLLLPAAGTALGAAIPAVLGRLQQSFRSRYANNGRWSPRGEGRATWDPRRRIEEIIEGEYEILDPFAGELPPGRDLSQLGPNGGLPPGGGLPPAGGGPRALPPGQPALPAGRGAAAPPAQPRALPPAAGQAGPQAGSADEVLTSLPPELQQNEQIRRMIGDLIEQRNVAQRMADMDPLVNLGNKRALNRALPTAEADPGMQVVVFDARRFKAVNDTYGHLEGDEVLLHFANTLDGVANEMGIPPRNFRQGGDEFSALVPRDQAEQFRSLVVERSRREYTDGIVTHLDGWVADDFATADAQLMAYKETVRDPSARVGVTEAVAEANTLTKHAQIAESPALNELAVRPEFDDFDVAKALIAKAPHETSVIRGVGDLGKVIRRIAQSQVEGGIGPQDFRVVQRGDRTDILVRGDKGLSNKQVNEYRDYGMFAGQRGYWRGNEVVIEQPGSNMVGVRGKGSKEPTMVPASELQVGNRSVTAVGAPEAFTDLRKFVGRYMANEAEKAGIPLPPWYSDQTTSQLPRLMEDFLDKQGITNAIEREAWKAYFNEEWIEGFKRLAPEELAESRAMQKAAAQEVTQAAVQDRLPIQTIEDIAATKGFAFVPETGPNNTGGGMLVDEFSDLRVPVDDERAAVEFIRNFEREIPDNAPMTSAIDAIENVPGGMNPGNNREPDFIDAVQQTRASARNTKRAETQLMELERAAANLDDLTRPTPMVPAGGGPTPPGGGPPGRGNLPGGGGPGGKLPPGEFTLGQQFAQADKDALGKIEQMQNSVLLRYGAPMRRYMLKMQQALEDAGIDARNWTDYDDLTRAYSIMHNEAEPWLNQATDLVKKLNRKWRRDGTAVNIEEIGEPGSKLRAMKSVGYSDAQIEAQQQLRPMLDELHRIAGETGPIGYIFDYLPHLRLYQTKMQGAKAFDAWERELPSEFQWFARELREGEVQIRQMDLGVLLTKYIRGLFFERHVAPTYNMMTQKWSDPRIPDSIAGPVTGWLKTVKTGMSPKYDMAVNGVADALQSMKIPVTESEVARLWSFTLANMYRGGLGLRPDVIFRDSIQPLMAGAQLGFKYTRQAYMDFFKNPVNRDLMWEMALKHGWVQKSMPQVISAEVFTRPAMTGAGNPQFGPGQEAWRERGARVGDLIYDMTPEYFRSGVQGTWVDPLHFYTKEGEFNRLITGWMGWRRAEEALGQMAPTVSIDETMKASGANMYPRPIQDKARSLLMNQDEEGFKALMANEAANSQFRYGLLEQPVGVREAGTKGKFALQYGTFTQQYSSWMRERLTNGSARERAEFAARYGTVAGALTLAGAKLGWDFSKWMWHQSIGWYANLGPMVEGAIGGWRAGGGALLGVVEGEDAYITPEQRRAMQQVGSGDVARGIASQVNPVRGGIQTFQNFANIPGGPNPVEQTVRTALTGQPGMGPTFERFFEGDQWMPYEVNPTNAGMQGQVEFNTAQPQNPQSQMPPAARREWERNNPGSLPRAIRDNVPPEVADTIQQVWDQVPRSGGGAQY